MEKYKRLSEASVMMKKLKFKGATNDYILKMGISHTNHYYFSFTVDILNKRGRDIGGGADHKTMIKVFPPLKKYINLHLSDIDGTPMYALENGFYYLQNPQTYNSQVVADHFRIPLLDAKKMQDSVQSGAMTKEDVAKFVLSQKPRWKKEANNCIKWLKSLKDYDE